MAVYTTYTIKPQIYSGAVAGCIDGGADYRTVSKKEVIDNINLAVDAGMKGISNACTITNIKMNCKYRVTNTSNNSGLTLKGKFQWVPVLFHDISINGTEMATFDTDYWGALPNGVGNTMLNSDFITIDSERGGNTSYASYSYNKDVYEYNTSDTSPMYIGGHFRFTSLNSITTCRMWLNEVSFTITRTRCCKVLFSHGMPGYDHKSFSRVTDYGTSPVYNEQALYPLVWEGHTFKGWKASDGTIYTGTLPVVGEVDIRYSAVWEINKYTVKFVNYDGTVLQSISVEYNNQPSYTGNTPTRASTAEYTYTFSGWSPSISTVTSDTTYTAQFTATKRKYKITVNTGTGGTVTGGGTYEHGSTATITATPNTGYKFVKWNDGNTSATRTITVTGGATYTATFEKIKVTATFKNHDGAVLQSVSVDYGSTPSYTGSTPTKNSTVEYTYTFSGWSPALSSVTADTIYTAQFTANKRKYILTISVDTGGSVSGGGTYEYGSTVTLKAIANAGYEFVKWNDGNTSASRTIAIAGDITYTAYFRINRILSDTSFAKKLLIDFDEIKAIKVDTTKVYG